ncbi:lytic murein transglycosylase [Pelagibius marinus]|uniref:lytic murein transglycosylase n=1 Tax=Pelagibius marinus TaxID=2762760 RepID=UPI0029CA37AB|nr:lytic murein transglycosylase [Pelagibius marinus]
MSFLNRILRAGTFVLAVASMAPLAACAQGDAAENPAPATGGKQVAQGERGDFDTWLAGLKQEAIRRGIRAETVETALAGVEPLPEVIERDRSQREFTLTFTRYMRGAVTEGRVAKARQLLEENRALLEKVAAQYGVQPRFLVSFWGLESNFGQHTGGYSVIAALATLAHEGRRHDFFRAQLLDALQILDEGHISVAEMTGSWAGAMGQLQFIPSTFVNFAVDYDGDGHRDIWHSLPDIFASAANYLSQEGWKGDRTWGRQVSLPISFDYSLASLGERKTLGEWAALGLRRQDGGPLPLVDGVEASLVLPAGQRGPAFLVYENFRTILVWNRSILYALSVGHLADRIDGAPALSAASLPDEEPLSLKSIEEMQALLNARGYEAGKPDGLVGPKTREALRSFQAAQGLPADGYPTKEVIDLLRRTGGQ